MLSVRTAVIYGSCWCMRLAPRRSPCCCLLHTTPLSLNQQLQQGKPALQTCYRLLQVEEDCEDAELREAYIKLVKQYHPDSDSKGADAAKFSQVKEAYQCVQKERQLKEGKKAEEESVEFDIRHTAPQHRQYLSYEGVGSGTPSKRQRQYQQYRVARATDTVYEYRTQQVSAKHEGALVRKDKKATKKQTIRNAIERLVEDLIQESMAKGEFDNLPGKGKKLKYTNYNPFVDTVTHNLNRILIDNGYAPDWVMLEKDIRGGIDESRRQLFNARAGLGTAPISPKQNIIWDRHKTNFVENLQEINANIYKFNLIAPTLRQQWVPFTADREIKKIVDKYEKLRAAGELPEVVANQNTRLSANENVVSEISFVGVWKDIKALFASYGEKKS